MYGVGVPRGRLERYCASLGLAYAGLGRAEEAIVEARRAVEIMPVERDAMIGPHALFHLAAVLSRVGHVHEALDVLEQLLSVPSRYPAAVLENHFLLEPLWNNPRFQALIEAERNQVF